MNRKSLDTIVNPILVVAAVIVAAGMVRVAFFGVPGGLPSVDRTPTRVASWEDDVASVGHTIMGDPGAAVTISMLGDLECPACAGFYPTLEDAVHRWGTTVRAVYISVPLEYHRFARPAAQASECAEQAGVLRDWLRLVYEKQDSLGIKTWESYADEAGLADAERMRVCALAPDTFSRIHAAMDFAENINFYEVPTVMVNGWKLGRPPTPDELDEVIQLILDGEDPPGAQ